MNLSDRLAERIQREGPLRFDEFQRAALYDPDEGYYQREGRIGPEGDFVTGSTWHPAFARAMLRIAGRLREQLGEPLTLLDAGSGEGGFLAHLAAELGDASWLRLTGVEQSHRRRRIAADRVPTAALHDDLSAMPEPIRGLAVAYELVDALPVRALRIGEDGVPLERRVALRGGCFVWAEARCPDGPEVLDRLRASGVRLEPGQLVEIRPGAKGMARQLARSLEAGVLLIFDYGAPARALYGPARFAGTLEAFREQRVSRDVLSEPGCRDITAWVDFTELEEALRAEGMVVHGLVSQSRLLLAAGLGHELAPADPERADTAERSVERNAIAKLVAPGGMGELIRVLVAGRGTSTGAGLMHLPV